MNVLPSYLNRSHAHYVIIPLTRDKVAFVDVEDIDLAEYKWHISNVYATRRVGERVLTWRMPPHFLHSSNTSGYRGVTCVKSNGKWQASYRQGKKLLHLGTYDKVEDAARAYDRAVIEIKGKQAITNFPLEDYERK